MSFILPELPYDKSAFGDLISAETFDYHHGKHHKAYVDNLNKALTPPEAGEFADMEVEELLYSLQHIPASIQTPIRNNAGGHFNHSFFWNTLTPTQNAKAPIGHSAKAIDALFGSFAKFQEEFQKAAVGRFGSGWVWLIINMQNQLQIVQTPYQDNPLMDGLVTTPGLPIMGLDVWEHAYYLKYQNRRADYVKAFWNVINWEQVETYFKMALHAAQGGGCCGGHEGGCGCGH